MSPPQTIGWRLLAGATLLSIALALAACQQPMELVVPESPTADTLSPLAPSPEPAKSPGATEDVPTESPPASAANADVEFVRAVQASDGSWTLHVTVRHPDTGWEDDADGWDVVLPDGSVTRPDEDSPFTRLLLHPHENEQPFTRSQSGITIPNGVTRVTVRAHDLVDGWGGREIVVELSASSGPGFEVQR